MYSSFSWAPEFRHPHRYTSTKIAREMSLFLSTKKKKILFNIKFLCSFRRVSAQKNNIVRGKIPTGWRRLSFYLTLYDFLGVFFVLSGFLSRTFTIHRTAGEGVAITLTSFYHFHHLTDTQTLARRLLKRVHLCSQLVARLEPGKFGFRTQVANHWEPTELSNLKEKVVKPISSQYSTHKESSQLRWIKLRVEKTELATESQQKQ